MGCVDTRGTGKLWLLLLVVYFWKVGVARAEVSCINSPSAVVRIQASITAGGGTSQKHWRLLNPECVSDYPWTRCAWSATGQTSAGGAWVLTAGQTYAFRWCLQELTPLGDLLGTWHGNTFYVRAEAGREIIITQQIVAEKNIQNNQWSIQVSGGGGFEGELLGCVAEQTEKILEKCPTAPTEWTRRQVLVNGVWVEQRRPCPSKSCCPDCAPGKLTAELRSLELTMGLGRSEFGQSAGSLQLKAVAPTPALSSPAALALVYPEGVEAVTNATGVLRQVLAPQTLADVVTVNAYQYEIRFYPRASVGAKSNGLYEVSGLPFKTVSIQNPDASPALYNRLLVTETENGTATLSQYVWTAPLQQWELVTGGGVRHQLRASAWDAAGSNRTDTLLVQDNTGQVLRKETETWRVFAWGTNLVQRVVDPDTSALTQRWDYYENPSADGVNYTQVRQVVQPSGYWERYEYDSRGRQTKLVAQHGNAPTNSAENQCRVVATTYTNIAPHETIVTMLLGREIARLYRARWSGFTHEEQCTTNAAAWLAASSLVTTTRWYTSGPFSNQTSRVQRPDGTLSLSTYALAAEGTLRTSTNDSGAANAAGTAVTSGTRTIRTVDLAGHLRSETVFDIASGLLVGEQNTLTQDVHGRPLTSTSLAGTNQTIYGCCGVTWTCDAEGLSTRYSYDQLGRQLTMERAGVITSNVYDAADRLLATFRNAVLISSNAYDLAGRLLRAQDALGRTTSYQETRTQDGETVKTTIYADNSTRIATYYQDGQLKSLTGTAVHGVGYQYGVELEEGAYRAYTKETKLTAAGAETAEWTKTYTDMLGRAYKTVFADGSYTQSWFNRQGQAWKKRDPDGVIWLFAYNQRGELETTALDMDRNDQIDYGGTDRIIRTQRTVASRPEATVQRTTTTVYTTDNSEATETVSATDLSVAGGQVWNVNYGLTNRAEIVVDRAQARKTVSTTVPDGSSVVHSYTAGRLVAEVRRDADGRQLAAASYQYDPAGRLWVMTDGRGGQVTCSYDDADQLLFAVIGGQTNSWFHDSRGRVTASTLPDGAKAFAEYFATGETRKTWGARTYPAEYTYDHAGRLQTMTTWQNFAGGGGRAVTTWNYQPQRGYLLAKVYADNSSVLYSNTPAQRLARRTWARGVSADYTYNNAGELFGIDYSDATPDLGFTYDRRGRPLAVSSGSGAVAYTYNNAGQLLAETHNLGTLAGLVVTNTYDGLLRRTAVQVLSPAFHLPPSTFAYDFASRLASVAQGSVSATYGYHEGAASLVSNLLFSASGSDRLRTTKNYDELGRLTRIETTDMAAQILDAHSYAFTAANQHSQRTDTDSSRWEYGYDSFGQVTSAIRRWADQSLVVGQQYGYQFDDIGNRTHVTRNSGLGAVDSTYSANLLNQYTTRTIPGMAWEFGSAASAATVTINNQPVTRQGPYFAGEFSVPNTSSAVYTQLLTVGVLSAADANGPDIVSSQTGHLFVARSPESFAYDLDGNLTRDGRWSYTWDAENRLISIETDPAVAATVGSSFPRQRFEFAYDHQSRRIAKKAYTWNVDRWSLTADLRFAWDGWNLLAEIADTSGQWSVVRSYGWGLDLSGTEQEAGGSGGLLWSTFHLPPGSSHFYGFDGNGNVAALLNTVTCQLSAEYAYGPFGEPLRATGPAARDNPFRFSGHYLDQETGLLYAKHRYYSSATGRWLSRDPLEEGGGIGLYGYVFNDPVNGIDTDGQKPRLANVPKDLAGGLFNMVRLTVGIPFSILSGDMFDDNRIVEKFSSTTCRILITINGIRNNDKDAATIRASAKVMPRHAGSEAVAVRNGTHTWLGDVVQIVGHEIGAIDIVSSRTARQLEAARRALKQNNCDCGCIYVLAHSQGSMVFNRALPLLSEKTRSLICYTGIGPEKIIQTSWGLPTVENYGNANDSVPVFANRFNPLRLADLPQMVHGQRITRTESPIPYHSGHGFEEYRDFLATLPDTCPLTKVE